jgi:hypothetical protein
VFVCVCVCVLVWCVCVCLVKQRGVSVKPARPCSQASNCWAAGMEQAWSRQREQEAREREEAATCEGEHRSWGL